MPRRFRTKAYATRTASAISNEANTQSLFDALEAPAAAQPATLGPTPAAHPASNTASTSRPDLQMHTTQAGIDYAEAQRLMAIGRSQGPQALTPQQHQAIWDCLLDLPQSQRWLADQLNALQGELNASDA